MFDSVVTPSVLYGLTTAPFTANNFEQLAVAQKKMLRLIVGYVKLDSDTWADMYRRMKDKIQNAATIFPFRDWAVTLQQRKDRLNSVVSQNGRDPLTCKVAVWRPDNVLDEKFNTLFRRRCGRPRATWIDH